jgi:hypothetical protein
LLPGDDQKEYELFADAVTTSLAPQDAVEEEIVQRIIDSMWVRRRIQQIESGYPMGDEIDPAVFADLWSRLPDSLSRYAAAKDRVIFRALQELRRVQDRRMEELSYSPVQRFCAEHDKLRRIQKLVAKRADELAHKPIGKANTNDDQAATHGRRALSTLSVEAVEGVRESNFTKRSQFDEKHTSLGGWRHLVENAIVRALQRRSSCIMTSPVISVVSTISTVLLPLDALCDRSVSPRIGRAGS